MKEPGVAGSPADGQVYNVVPLEDLNEFDRVDTSHFVTEPTLDSLGGLANFVLGSSSEFLFLFEDLEGLPVLSGIVFAVTTPDGVGRAILPAHDRIVSSVWEEACKCSSSTSRERLSVVCAEVLVERGTAFMSAYTDALPIAVAKKLRGKHNGREVTAQYVLGNYGLMPQEAVKAHVVGVSADFMVSDAVKVLYRKDSETVNPVAVGRSGWAHVGWLQWRMSPATGLELGLGFGAPFGEADSLPCVPLVPVFKDTFKRMVMAYSPAEGAVGATFMSIIQDGTFKGNGDEFTIGGALYTDGRYAYDADSGVYAMPIIIEQARATAKVFMVR
jgi:hypothetical protein